MVTFITSCDVTGVCIHVLIVFVLVIIHCSLMFQHRPHY